MIGNKKGQMIGTYLIILFGISMVFYLGGYKPIMFETFNQEVGSDKSIGQSFVNTLANTFTDPTFLTLIGFATVAGFLQSGSSFSAVFLVPMFFIIAFANMLILPSSFLFDPTIGNNFVRIGIGVFMNIFLLLALLNFIQGTGA